VLKGQRWGKSKRCKTRLRTEKPGDIDGEVGRAGGMHKEVSDTSCCRWSYWQYEKSSGGYEEIGWLRNSLG
jgi:hypothetical protein